MARHKSGAADVQEERKAAAVRKDFDPASLSPEEQAAVVAYFLGVHPRYFLYKGLNIQLNMGKIMFDKKQFNGWKPASHKYNSFDPGK